MTGLAALWAGWLLWGCAAQQVVPLGVEPAPVDVYVDGRLVASGAPESVTLRVDRGHVLLVRRAGYRTEQVVIESVTTNGTRRLEPARIDLVLVPNSSPGRRIDVELDAPVAPDAGDENARPNESR